MISLTFDMELAPPEIVKPVIDLLKEHDIKATFFCTKENIVERSPNYERGVHTDFKLGSEHEEFARMKREIPSAIGMRSHRHFFHGRLPYMAPEHGIKYDSSYLIPSMYVEPFMLFGRLAEFPIFFMDNHSVETGIWPKYEAYKFLPHVTLAFHPIHIYLNTATMQQYYERRKQDKVWGVRNYFRGLLDFIKANKIESSTLGAAYERFRLSMEKSPAQGT